MKPAPGGAEERGVHPLRHRGATLDFAWGQGGDSVRTLQLSPQAHEKVIGKTEQSSSPRRWAGATLQGMHHLPFTPVNLPRNLVCQLHDHPMSPCFLGKATCRNFPRTIQLTKARPVLTHTKGLSSLSPCTQAELQPYKCSTASVLNRKTPPQRGTVTPKMGCF